jgi:hypothetical protein
MMPDLNKPEEALAHYLSEWLNDSAPIGWRRYLPVAQAMIQRGIVSKDCAYLRAMAPAARE